MTLHLDALHKSLKAQSLIRRQEHKEVLKSKQARRKANAQRPYTPEEDVDFTDVKYLKAGRARMGDHSGWTGAELRAIRREKGVGRPV